MLNFIFNLFYSYMLESKSSVLTIKEKKNLMGFIGWVCLMPTLDEGIKTRIFFLKNSNNFPMK